MATGTFTDAIGHVTGDVTIAAAADVTFVLSIAGFSSSIATAELSAGGDPITPDQRCFTEEWRMGLEPTPHPTSSWSCRSTTRASSRRSR